MAPNKKFLESASEASDQKQSKRQEPIASTLSRDIVKNTRLKGSTNRNVDRREPIASTSSQDISKNIIRSKKSTTNGRSKYTEDNLLVSASGSSSSSLKSLSDYGSNGDKVEEKKKESTVKKTSRGLKKVIHINVFIVHIHINCLSETYLIILIKYIYNAELKHK